MNVLFLITMSTMVLFPLLIIIVYSSGYKRVPPNKAMIIYGRKTRSKVGFYILTGGGKFIMPVVESVAYLPLDVRTLHFDLKNIKTEDLKSKTKINIKAVSQIKIASDQASLATAAEQLLDKPDEEINKIAQNIIEGHIKGFCATMTVDAIHHDRDALVERIQCMAAMDMQNFGLEIRNMVISDLKIIENY